MTKIIGGSSSKKIAYDLAVNLNVDYVDAVVAKFADQELRIQLSSHLYEENVIIVQSTCKPTNDHLMELLLLIDAVKRAGSHRIIAAIPYFGYSRQDRSSYECGPISAKLVATLLESAGVDHIIVVDLHSKQIEGFFKIGVQNIDPTSFFAAYIEKSNDIVVISPDIGGLIRARRLAGILQADLAIINKTRNDYNSCEMNTIIGNISGKNCVIIDDIIDTGETICKATALLRQQGAKGVRIIATHAVLSNEARQKLAEAPIDSILLTNSIPQELDSNRFKILDITPIIADTIRALKCL
jgi:ribose-phosphate pyrophosphokinase